MEAVDPGRFRAAGQGGVQGLVVQDADAFGEPELVAMGELVAAADADIPRQCLRGLRPEADTASLPALAADDDSRPGLDLDVVNPQRACFLGAGGRGHHEPDERRVPQVDHPFPGARSEQVPQLRVGQVFHDPVVKLGGLQAEEKIAFDLGRILAGQPRGELADRELPCRGRGRGPLLQQRRGERFSAAHRQGRFGAAGGTPGTVGADSLQVGADRFR